MVGFPPFHTEIFMYIVAPLIYFEGQSTRINLIGKRLRQILETAVLLVIVGTVFAGFSVLFTVEWMSFATSN